MLTQTYLVFSDQTEVGMLFREGAPGRSLMIIETLFLGRGIDPADTVGLPALWYVEFEDLGGFAAFEKAVAERSPTWGGAVTEVRRTLEYTEEPTRG